MKKEFRIMAGAFTTMGNGNSEVKATVATYEEALELFENQVSYERRTIKDWCLAKNDYVEVELVEVTLNEDGEELDWETYELFKIFKDGSIIK